MNAFCLEILLCVFLTSQNQKQKRFVPRKSQRNLRSTATTWLGNVYWIFFTAHDDREIYYEIISTNLPLLRDTRKLNKNEM